MRSQDQRDPVEAFVVSFNSDAEVLRARNSLVGRINSSFRQADSDRDGIFSAEELALAEQQAINLATSALSDSSIAGDWNIEEVIAAISNGFASLATDDEGAVTASEFRFVRGNVIRNVDRFYPQQSEDNRLTREELGVAIQTRFVTVDEDLDGLLSQQELEVANIEGAAARASTLVDRADKNGDGVISTGESFNLVTQMINSGVDTDEDGRLSASELEAQFAAEQSELQLSILDDDDDGNISLQEYGEGQIEMFDSMDEDSDGVISVSTS